MDFRTVQKIPNIQTLALCPHQLMAGEAEDTKTVWLDKMSHVDTHHSAESWVFWSFQCHHSPQHPLGSCPALHLQRHFAANHGTVPPRIGTREGATGFSAFASAPDPHFIEVCKVYHQTWRAKEVPPVSHVPTSTCNDFGVFT